MLKVCEAHDGVFVFGNWKDKRTNCPMCGFVEDANTSVKEISNLLQEAEEELDEQREAIKDLKAQMEDLERKLDKAS